MKIPPVVLDTNCVVSALLFSGGRLAWLRDAWASRRFVPLVSRDTAGELIRVLSYPKFQLAINEQEMLLADYLPFTEVVDVNISTKNLPALRDPHDLMFVELALAGKAHVLVSGDADLSALHSHLGRISVIAPSGFAEWLEEFLAG